MSATMIVLVAVLYVAAALQASRVLAGALNYRAYERKRIKPVYSWERDLPPYEDWHDEYHYGERVFFSILGCLLCLPAAYGYAKVLEANGRWDKLPKEVVAQKKAEADRLKVIEQAAYIKQLEETTGVGR